MATNAEENGHRDSLIGDKNGTTLVVSRKPRWRFRAVTIKPKKTPFSLGKRILLYSSIMEQVIASVFP